jgi:hypothetical protein
MDMTSAANIAQVVGAVVALIVALCGAVTFCFWRIDAVRSTLQKESETRLIAVHGRIDEVRRESENRNADLVRVTESKLQKIDDDVTRLSREAVRKDELSSMELRLRQDSTKLESKFDALGMQFAKIAVLESRFDTLHDVLKQALAPARAN